MSTRNPESRSTTRSNWWLLILLLPGLLSALVLGARRHDLEARNKNVELVLDYTELQSLSLASETPIPTILRRFKTSGVTGVAISEEVLGDLTSTGQVTYTRRNSAVGSLTVIRLQDRHLQQRVFKALSSRFSPRTLFGDTETDSGRAQSAAMPTTFVVRAAPETLNEIGIGLSPDAVRLVKREGLDVVARLQNHPALTKRAIDAAAQDMKGQGITRLICAGEEVFGFRGLIAYSARVIKSSGLVYGSIEFAGQKGDSPMRGELGSEFVRVHSIPTGELAGMSPRTAAERFARAAKERNIRLCYVRLPATSGEAPVRRGVDFVLAISRGVEEAGYEMGPAAPFGSMARPRLLLASIALAVAAGAVMLLGSLVSLSPAVRYGLLAIALVAAVGLTLGGETGRRLVALSAALVFPTLGITAFIGPQFSRQAEEKEPVAKAVGLFAGASLLTLCGALLVMGLLADRSYMVKANQFTGVKVSHLLPMLVVVFAIAAGLPILGKPFARVRKEVMANLRRVAAHPLFVWHAIAVVAALAIVGLALLRTGNEPGVGVTGIELKVRAILDQLMAVRPRTKEFLIGHPALLLGIALLLTRRRAWGLPLVALGVLGQVSLLNTFCHIHTPLHVTVLRAGNGLLLGLLLGIAAWYVFGRPRTAGDEPDRA